MSEIVYRIVALLEQLVADVPVGTNLGLLHLLFAIMSGRLLWARGAVFPALAEWGLCSQAVRRSSAALRCGQWQIADLLACWQRAVRQESHFVARCYEGIRPVPCDLVGFFRPHLHGCLSKHYTSQADKALPAVVLGMVGAVGSVGTQRLALLRHLVRAQDTDTSEADLQQRLVEQAQKTLAEDEALITDAGFKVGALLDAGVTRFVCRVAKNATFRRNSLPASRGGRPPEWGEIVRPLARVYNGKTLPATKPDAVARWKAGGQTVRAHIYHNLVLREHKPGATCLRVVVIFDARYPEPLVLATSLDVSAYAVGRLYKDRWPIEQVPLAAKQRLGAERSFVFGKESRHRLPELALLAGNVLSYVAATSQPMASGFWDRWARPTCGRLRRQLSRLTFSDLPLVAGQVRKKNSVTTHLPQGVRAHRRTRAASDPLVLNKAA